jgi:hypothetical protein
MADSLPSIWNDPAQAIGDLLIEQGLEQAAPALSQIPLLSIAIAAYKSKGAISDYLLAKKVQRFYTAWDDLPESERRDIYQKFQKRPKAFTEKLLFILAQQEDLGKCKLLGVLTTSYLRGDLRRAEYLDFIETVAHLALQDLLLLNKLTNLGVILPERKVGERYANLFVGRGLLASEPSLPPEQRSGKSRHYRVTRLGNAFIAQVQLAKLKEPV